MFEAATCSKSHLIVHIYYSVKEAVAQQIYWVGLLQVCVLH